MPILAREDVMPSLRAVRRESGSIASETATEKARPMPKNLVSRTEHCSRVNLGRVVRRYSVENDSSI